MDYRVVVVYEREDRRETKDYKKISRTVTSLNKHREKEWSERVFPCSYWSEKSDRSHGLYR